MAAQFVAFGKTLVPVAGTPVRVVYPSTLRPPNVHALIIQADPRNVGKIYIGLEGMDTNNFANVLVVLPIPTANMIPTFSIAVTIAANGVNVGDLWIDAELTGEEGVLISALVA